MGRITSKPCGAKGTDCKIQARSSFHASWHSIRCSFLDLAFIRDIRLCCSSAVLDVPCNGSIMSCTLRISFIPRFARSLYRQLVGAFAIVAQHQCRFLLSTLIDLPSLPPCCH